MAKLEELTAMMVTEIELFATSVEKLENIRKKQFVINSSKLETLLKEHQETMQKSLVSHKQEMKNLGYRLEKSRSYPVWALTTFVISLILNGILMYTVLSGIRFF